MSRSVNNGTLKVSKGILATTVGGSGAGTYNLLTGTQLNVNGGLFDVSGATVTGAGTFNLNGGGALKGSPAAANLVLNGGSLTGGGTITFPTGSTVTITSQHVNIDGDTAVVNNGTLTSNDGTIYLYDGTFTNNATWTWKSPTNMPIYDLTDAPGNVFTNAVGGTVDVAPALATDTTTLGDAPLVNNGTLKVSKGTLITGVGGLGTGTYNLLTGTQMRLDGGFFDISGAEVIGAGQLVLNSGGAVTGTGSATNLVINDGTLAGTGTLTLVAGGTSSIPASKTVWIYDTYKLVNNGTLTQAGEVRLVGDPNVENGGTWALTMSGQAVVNWDSAPKDAWVNKATGLMTSQPGAANTVDFGGIRLTNQGELKNLNGTTNVSLTNLSVGGVLSGGTLTVQAGTLGVNANLVTIGTGTTVTVVAGGITNTTTATSALPALRTNNGTLTLSVSVTVTGNVTNAGTVWLKGGTFRPLTTYTQTAGSTRVDAPAVLKGGSAGTGAIAITGGSLTGGGTVHGPVTNAALVQPGGAGTALGVTGTFTQTSAGTFAALVNGTTTPGTQFSKLAATGAATLSGTLAIQTGVGVDPPVGTTVRILDAASRSGTFSSITGRDTLPVGKYWGVTYDATGVSLQVMQDPMATVGSASVTEGDAGTTTLTLQVTLDQASQRHRHLRLRDSCADRQRAWRLRGGDRHVHVRPR